MTDTNLVGSWDFETGTVFDSSGYFPDVNEDDANGVLLGGELVLDGTSGSGVDCNDYAKFDCNDGFTIVFRVQYDTASLGDYRGLVAKHDYTGYRIGVEAIGKLFSQTTLHDPNEGFNLVNSADINDPNWHHVAYLYDGATIKIMIDTGQAGAAINAAVTSGGKVATNDHTLKFGLGASPAQTFIGKMDDIQIYNYGMSQYGVGRLVGSVDVNVAYDPTPADTAIDQPENAQLSWRAGEGAISHDVYFGTVNPPTLLGNDTPITADPGTLEAGVTYYWRINEVNAGGTEIGVVWSFSVSAVTAKAVDPYEDVQYVPVDANLVWQAGLGATSHDLYFGITNPPPSIGNQAGITYDPPSDVDNDTVYYWRVDEINAGGTVTGSVWSFTTVVTTPRSYP